MWPFSSKKPTATVRAHTHITGDGEAVIDVRGQTCPGYLLAINKAVDMLDEGTEARLLISYPPCGDDVRAWCRERHIDYLGLSQAEGMWQIRIRK